MPLNSLFDIIQKVRERNPGFSKRYAEAEALGRWPLAVGEVISKHAQAIRVQDGVLWVEVDHPIWRAELHYRKTQILDILNGKIPGAKELLAPPQKVLLDIYFVSKSRNQRS
jgi:hypothetical protein